MKGKEIFILAVCGLSSVFIIHGSRLSPALALAGLAVVCGLLLWGVAQLCIKVSLKVGKSRLGVFLIACVCLALPAWLVFEAPLPPIFGNHPAQTAPVSACDVPPGSDLCGTMPLLCRAEKGDAAAADSYARQSVEAADNECRNVDGSVELLRKAAQAGHVEVQRHLAELLISEGGTGNDAEGATWLRGAALQGDAIAEDDLGYLYENGLGVPQDFEKAYFWFGMAEGRVGGVTRSFAEVFDVPFVAPGEVGQHRKAASRHLSSAQKAAVDARVVQLSPSWFNGGYQP